MRTIVQTDTDPTVSTAVGDTAASLTSIVADMTSLITHVRTTASLIDAAIRRGSEGHDNEEANVVVLDDVTPCYATANAALSACSVSLDAALRSLRSALAQATPSPDRPGRSTRATGRIPSG